MVTPLCGHGKNVDEGAVIFDGSGVFSESTERRSRHRARRRQASASAKEGVAFWGYQGSGIHERRVFCVSRYQSQTAE
jgi:hypothetical protein